MNIRNYRTTKGTELPLLNLRGKEYLEVKYRLVWFREDHPDWSIETELKSVTDVSAYARATIRDEQGRIIATSHKFESIQGFPDFIEKAETGAIGRALALIGYGTQFCADELDEGARIVDAPVNARADKASDKKEEKKGKAPVAQETKEKEQPQFNPGDYTINFGRKYKGRKLREIPRKEVESYIEWLENSALKPGTALEKHLQYLKNAYQRYIAAAS